MGKTLHMNSILDGNAMYQIIKEDSLDWRLTLNEQLLEHLSTSGAGDFVDVLELAEWITGFTIAAVDDRTGGGV